MRFVEKIKRLTAGRNRSELSRAAGLPATALDAVVNKEREPLARNAVRIAKVIGVPPEWLFDDEANWPPPEAGVKSMGDFELVEELASRRKLALQEFRRIIERFRDNAALSRLEKLAARERKQQEGHERLDPHEREILDAAVEDFARLFLLDERLRALDPTRREARSSRTRREVVDDLFAECPNFYGQIAELRFRHAADGSLSIVHVDKVEAH